MLFLILFNMLLSLCDDCPYMTICKRVEHRFSFSSALYQLILLQNAKLVVDSSTLVTIYPFKDSLADGSFFSTGIGAALGPFPIALQSVRLRA